MSGFLTLGACGYRREAFALLEAIDQEDGENGALMYLASLAEDWLRTDKAGLARAILSEAWCRIGDDALAWAATRKARFRPRGLLAVALDILNRDDLEEGVREKAFNEIIELWAEQHPHFFPVQKVFDDFFERLKRSQDLASAPAERKGDSK